MPTHCLIPPGVEGSADVKDGFPELAVSVDARQRVVIGVEIPVDTLPRRVSRDEPADMRIIVFHSDKVDVRIALYLFVGIQGRVGVQRIRNG